jgi:hypothetical protein
MTGWLAPQLSCLPADLKARIAAIGEAGRGPFGRRSTQAIVAEHLEVLHELRDGYGASHADIAELLRVQGITAREGAALSAGTVSSAISRASADIDRTRRRSPAPRAPTGTAPRAPAQLPGAMPPVHGGHPGLDAAAPPRSAPSSHSPGAAVVLGRSMEDPSTGAASALRAGSILNQLAAEKD